MKNHYYDLTIFDLVFVLKWNSGKWSVSLHILIICLDNFLLILIISHKNSSIVRITNAIANFTENTKDWNRRNIFDQSLNLFDSWGQNKVSNKCEKIPIW